MNAQATRPGNGRVDLFPLDTVVFPGGTLQLRIFEPRYHELVSACLTRQEGFGICLSHRKRDAETSEIEEIKMVKELGNSMAQFHSVGTLVKIVDFDRIDNGMLGITVCGEQRFRVKSVDMCPNMLLTAEVEWMEEIEESITGNYRNFSDLLQEIASRFELDFSGKDDDEEEGGDYGKAIWVSGRLAELLPFELQAKQRLLEIDNPLSRLDYMQVLLEAIDAKRVPLM